jgi:hypothetical protein
MRGDAPVRFYFDILIHTERIRKELLHHLMESKRDSEVKRLVDKCIVDIQTETRMDKNHR